MSVRADLVPDSEMPVPVTTSDSPVDGSSLDPRAPNGPRSFYILSSLILRVQMTWLASAHCLLLRNLGTTLRLRQSYG